MSSRIASLLGGLIDIPKPHIPTPVPKRLPMLQPDITLPPGLRRPPRPEDLIIKRTFDGLTPEAAAAKIRGNHRGPIAPENEELVANTVAERVRDMQVALNNVFTPGSPHATFLNTLQPAEITVMGSLSRSTAVVYRVAQPGKEVKFYTRGWAGGFTTLPKPPIQVVMEGQLTLSPAGLRMEYPTWLNRALAGRIGYVEEL